MYVRDMLYFTQEKVGRKSKVNNLKNNKKKVFRMKEKSKISGALRALLVSILILVQFAFIFMLSLSMQLFTVYFYVILEIFSLIVILCLVNDDRSPSYKIAWISIVLLLPLSGHIMYALWGNEASDKKFNNNVLGELNKGFNYATNDPDAIESFANKYPEEVRISNYMSASHFPLYDNNAVDYYAMGEDVFEAMIKDFENAQKFILVDFFIVAEGKLWDRIHSVLYSKIQQGVKVLFMYDDFGAMFRTNKFFQEQLEDEGFEVKVFNPVHKYIDKLYMNFRSHQKIVVIDGIIGYTGGMNIADEYANYIQRFGVWKDTAVRIKGNAVDGLINTFLQMWNISDGKGYYEYNDFSVAKNEVYGDTYCHIISDGPANNPDNPIENVYRQMVYYSKEFLYITTPYLIIEDDMYNAIESAVKSGVDVRIITPKIPDKKAVKLLTNYNYGRLLKAGARIYEYTPGFIHAKMIVNESSAIVGTINMDYRSFYLHYECGAWMCSKDVVYDVKNDILNTIKVSEEITYEEWKNRPLKMKIYQSFLNLFQTLV